jgi:hypothetical protein
MKFAPLTFLFIICITSTAHARLGENADQLVARYGPPLTENDQKREGDKIALADVIFQKGGYRIEVTVTDGISVAEVFRKINGQILSVGEVRTLLSDNSQGFGWEAPHVISGETWWTRDDSATAHLTQNGSLVIKSKELVVEETTAKKVEAKPSLEGF